MSEGVGGRLRASGLLEIDEAASQNGLQGERRPGYGAVGSVGTGTGWQRNTENMVMQQLGAELTEIAVISRRKSSHQNLWKTTYLSPKSSDILKLPPDNFKVSNCEKT